MSNHGDAKLVGAEHEHLRMDLIQRQKPNTRLQAIAFQQPTHYEWIRSGRPIDVCYQIVENHYRGTVTTQLRVKRHQAGRQPLNGAPHEKRASRSSGAPVLLRKSGGGPGPGRAGSGAGSGAKPP